ncbi:MULTISPECIES: hypothetical protein [unclassified Nostoc]|nr:hypothetical protein [Nostoc sp. DedQUE03]MDZ7974824.1 hypothetical protein [Nostoc sp. DedQUE03]
MPSEVELAKPKGAEVACRWRTCTERLALTCAERSRASEAEMLKQNL